MDPCWLGAAAWGISAVPGQPSKASFPSCSMAGEWWPGTRCRRSSTVDPRCWSSSVGCFRLVVHVEFTSKATHTSRYSLRNVETHADPARRRRLLALVLAVVAIGLLVVEPFPKAEVLLSLTHAASVWRHPRRCPVTGRGLSCHLAWPQERGQPKSFGPRLRNLGSAVFSGS